jgi:hypothetical protein
MAEFNPATMHPASIITSPNNNINNNINIYLIISIILLFILLSFIIYKLWKNIKNSKNN